MGDRCEPNPSRIANGRTAQAEPSCMSDGRPVQAEPIPRREGGNGASRTRPTSQTGDRCKPNPPCNGHFTRAGHINLKELRAILKTLRDLVLKIRSNRQVILLSALFATLKGWSKSPARRREAEAARSRSA
jgi:hypothetical protein